MDKRILTGIISGVVILICTTYIGVSIVRGSLLGSFIGVVFHSDDSKFAAEDSEVLYSRAVLINNEIEQISAELAIQDEVSTGASGRNNNNALVFESLDDYFYLEDDGSFFDDDAEEGSEVLQRAGNDQCAEGTECERRSRRFEGGSTPSTSDTPAASDSTGRSPTATYNSAADTKAESVPAPVPVTRKATIAKLNTLVAERNELMSTLAKTNPKLFLSSRLSEDVYKKLPNSLRKELEKPVFLRGFVVATPSHSYFVTGNEILTLYSTHGVETNSIAAIQVSGIRLGNTVVAESEDIQKISPFFNDKRKH